MTANVHDVAIMCDFRYPGGTSTSIAEEVRAQAKAGLSTVLVHVPSPYNPAVCPFNPRIVECLREGWADMALDGDPVAARLLQIRQPRIFSRDLATVPKITTDATIMVINQAPGDLREPQRYYCFEEVRQRIEGYYGDAIVWAPISPQIRAQVQRVAPSAVLAGTDWHEIIDVAQWWVDRPGPVGDVPVIGRHGRPDVVKWPRTAEEILQAYPDTDDFRVRILGGADIAVQRVGHQPATWEALEFGSLPPREFLQTIDFFVYFHDPDLIEAFGRAILEALASGVPVIIPEHFRTLFGEAALYTDPAGVRDLVRSLYADRDSYRRVATRARGIVEERYGHSSHLARLARLGVQPRAAVPAPRTEVAAPSRRPAAAPATGPVAAPGPGRRGSRARVLMVSDNGAGLGHLTRLMAIGRRLPDGVQSIIATQSYGASVAHREGFLTEYIPSRKVLGMNKRRWNRLLRARLRHLIAIHRPTVVAVDSVPHGGFLDAIEDHPDLVWVSIRRAMWKRGVGQDHITHGAAFDYILEPGEFASPADQGATVADRANVRLVDPITFLDAGELLEAGAAREAVGLDDRPAVLLQLGAGNINDIASPVARIAESLTRRGFQLVLAESTIATEPLPRPPGARVVKLYPISRYLRGFDLVVSASGYNSFHELLAFGVPTIFVPTETNLDDQVARARYAALTSVALVIENVDSDELEATLDQAAQSDVRAALKLRCAELAFGNGAAEAAAWLGSLCSAGVRVGD